MLFYSCDSFGCKRCFRFQLEYQAWGAQSNVSRKRPWTMRSVSTYTHTLLECIFPSKLQPSTGQERHSILPFLHDCFHTCICSTIEEDSTSNFWQVAREWHREMNVAGAEVAPNKSACIHGKCRCLGNPDVVQGLHQRRTHLQPLCKNISHSKDVARHKVVLSCICRFAYCFRSSTMTTYRLLCLLIAVSKEQVPDQWARSQGLQLSILELSPSELLLVCSTMD